MILIGSQVLQVDGVFATESSVTDLLMGDEGSVVSVTLRRLREREYVFDVPPSKTVKSEIQ